jgi:hypothetical protein
MPAIERNKTSPPETTSADRYPIGRSLAMPVVPAIPSNKDNARVAWTAYPWTATRAMTGVAMGTAVAQL